jgi:uncharacterized protein (UPF0333 family)
MIPKMLKSKKGQVTVEYIILVAAVLAVIIVFVTSDNSPFKKAFNNALTTGTQGMTSMANALSNSR